MLKPTIHDSALSSWSEARARESFPRYRRSGASPSVLILDGQGESLWPEVLHVLGSNFRVSAPMLPPGSPRQTNALVELIENQGVSSMTVVAAADYGVPALDLVLRGVKQVTRLVLVVDGVTEDPTTPWFLGAAGPSSVPVLVVWRGIHGSAAIPAISRFVMGVGPG
jgi:hypothetical protein